MSSKYGYLAMIGADTSGLKAALSDVDNQTKKLTFQLKDIDKALQLNPGNTELLSQKFVNLSNQITQTKTKLEALKNAEQQVNAAFASGDIGTAQYEEYRRDVLNTEAALQELIRTQDSMIDESGNIRDVSNEFKNLDNNIQNAGQSTITLGDLIKANVLSEYIRRGISELTSKIGGFVKQGVELASDLTEVQNVVDTTFGDGATEIYEWADAAAESFGMSSLSAQKYTGTIGAMMKSQGIANDSILEMSENLVGLAGDMASFYNIDVESAFEKIRSGISGETEPLKQLGINMNVANMEAYALSQGIEKSWQSMDVAEQTMLRYNYLMSQTADAQGDFAKTSDSYANQQRILELQIENLSAALGEQLLPHLNDVISTANEKLPEIEDTVENIGEILGDVTGFALDHYEAIIGLVAAYGTFHGVLKAGNAIGTYVTSLKGLTTATQAATTAQQGMNAAAAVNPYALIAAGAAALIVVLVSLVSSIDSVSTSLKDTAEESVSAYEEQKEKVSELEAELEDVDEQIRQIQSRGKLNFTDEKELTNLQLQSEELRTQIALEKELLELKNKQVSEDAIKAIMSENSLSEGSIASVRRAIDEYKEAENGLKYWQDELNKAISEGNEEAIYEANENIEQYTSAINNAKIWILEAQEAVDGLAENLDTSAADGQAAAEAVNSLRNEVAGLLDITTKDYLDGFYANGTALDATGERYKKEYTAAQEAAEDTEAARAAREQALEDYVADLDERKKLRRINEDEYYAELKNYLDIHQDTESTAWFDQLERYEDYQQDKLDADKKAAEEAQKNAEKDAEEKQKAYEKSVEDYVDTLKTKLELDDEYTEDMYYDDLEKLTKNLDEQSELYKKYNNEVLKGRKELADKLSEETSEAWKKSTEELSSQLSDAYEDLTKQKEEARKELLDIDLSETVTDKNGNDVEVLTDLDAKNREMEQYIASLEKLEATGISDSLMKKISGMSYEDGSRQRYINTLLGLSEDKRQLYYSDWERLNETEKKAEEALFGEKEEELNKQAAGAVKEVFGDMSGVAYDEGVETAQSFFQGIIDSMGDTPDINAVAGILTSAYSDITGAARGSSKTGAGLDDTQRYVLANTPITINLNDNKYIKTTLQELIDAGLRSGGNVFNL